MKKLAEKNRLDLERHLWTKGKPGWMAEKGDVLGTYSKRVIEIQAPSSAPFGETEAVFQALAAKGRLRKEEVKEVLEAAEKALEHQEGAAGTMAGALVWTTVRGMRYLRLRRLYRPFFAPKGVEPGHPLGEAYRLKLLGGPEGSPEGAFLAKEMAERLMWVDPLPPWAEDMTRPLLVFPLGDSQVVGTLHFLDRGRMSVRWMALLFPEGYMSCPSGVPSPPLYPWDELHGITASFPFWEDLEGLKKRPLVSLGTLFSLLASGSGFYEAIALAALGESG